MPRAKRTGDGRKAPRAGGVPEDLTGRALAAILERSGEGIAIAGSDGKVRKVNPRCADLIGRPPEDVEGHPAGELAARWGLRRPDGSTADPAEVPLERAIRNGEEVTGEEWIIERPGGIRIPILWSAAPIHDAEGKVLGGVMLWRALAEPSPPARSRTDEGEGEEPVKILLVEDHADTANVLSHLLRSRGYAVRTAASLVEARTLARKERFELLVSDLALPDGSGHDLMRELLEAWPELRGIALSGYGMAEDIEASGAAGFAEHLTKPVEFMALLTAIERIRVKRA